MTDCFTFLCSALLQLYSFTWMVVTRKTPVAPVPTGSRTNSVQSLPRAAKAKSTSTLVESEPVVARDSPVAATKNVRPFAVKIVSVHRERTNGVNVHLTAYVDCDPSCPHYRVPLDSSAYLMLILCRRHHLRNRPQNPNIKTDTTKKYQK